MQQRVPAVTAPFRTPYRVEHLVHVGDTTNDRGQKVPLFETTLRDVYGWANAAANEQGNLNVVTLTDTVQLLVPNQPWVTTVKSTDRFRLQGVSYDVEGDPADFNHGPFGFKPGYVISLRRVK